MPSYLFFLGIPPAPDAPVLHRVRDHAELIATAERTAHLFERIRGVILWDDDDPSRAPAEPFDVYPRARMAHEKPRPRPTRRDELLTRYRHLDNGQWS